MYTGASPRKGMNTENRQGRTQPANVIEDLLYSQIKDQSVDYRGTAYAVNHNANPKCHGLAVLAHSEARNTSGNAFLPSFPPIVYTS